MGTFFSRCESSQIGVAILSHGSQLDKDEPLLLEDEREAVSDLLQYLENRTTTNFFAGSPLSTLTTLSYSDNVDVQRGAALAFAEITKKEDRPVGRNTFDPILFLLSSHDTELQRAASAALDNLATNTENKLLIVKLGGLEPLIRQMLSPNVEVQCNTAGCITNLATHDENRQQLVDAGAVPVLVGLLNFLDTDVQYYCTTALSNIAVDGSHRKRLAQNEPKLVTSLVQLMDGTSLEVQRQAALALRNLASDEKYKLEIVMADGLR